MVLHKKPLQKRFSRQGLGPYNRKIRSRVDFLNPLIGGKLDPGNPGVSTDLKSCRVGLTLHFHVWDQFCLCTGFATISLLFGVVSLNFQA